MLYASARESSTARRQGRRARAPRRTGATGAAGLGSPTRRRCELCESASARSFLSDWFSIWRMRSRVTLNVRPTSSSVRGSRRRARSEAPARDVTVRQRREDLLQRLLAHRDLGSLVGQRHVLVREEGPNSDSSSSPTGFSSDTGVCALRMICSTSSSGSRDRLRSRAGIGSRQSSARSLRSDPTILISFSTTCTGIMIVAPCRRAHARPPDESTMSHTSRT